MSFWGKLGSIGALAGGTGLMFVPGGQLAGGALLGAGLGGAKSEFIDEPKADAARKLRAETARYSPWTGMNAQNVAVPDVDPITSGMQGAMTGAMLGKQFGPAKVAVADPLAGTGSISVTDPSTGIGKVYPNGFIDDDSIYAKMLKQPYGRGFTS